MKLSIPERWQRRIKRTLPWYSFASGVWSAFFIARSYEHARWIAAFIAATWIALVVLALLRREIRRKDARWKHGAEFAVFWMSQSAAQEVLFFCLPFWIRSTTWTSRNGLFTAGLVLLALLAMIDPIYEKILADMRTALAYKSLVQFAGLGFLLPALFGTHTQGALALAGALSGAIPTLGLGRLRRPVVTAMCGAFLGAAMCVSAASWIAPVPLRLRGPVFCSRVVGHRPADSLGTAKVGQELWAWTPVFAPARFTDTLVHAWSRDGKEVARVPLRLQGGRKEGFRTWSSSRLAAAAPGRIHVDVLNSAGQILGRMELEAGR